jgi:hypothetical protein
MIFPTTRLILVETATGGAVITPFKFGVKLTATPEGYIGVNGTWYDDQGFTIGNNNYAPMP